jgi:hypothetical protein
MLANVSFGLLIFHPIGWLLMLMVVAVESLLLSKLLVGRFFSSRGAWLTLAANAVSGVLGAAISMTIDGGWWTVFWVPWVSQNEMSAELVPKLAAYMVVAFAMSTAVELPFLRKIGPRAFGHVLLSALLANALSSLLLMGVLGTLWLVHPG